MAGNSHCSVDWFAHKPFSREVDSEPESSSSPTEARKDFLTKESTDDTAGKCFV